MTTDIDDWNQHWRDYAQAARENPAQEYRRRLIFGVLSAGGPPRRLVDIGAGAGELLASASERWPSADLLGLELSAAGVEIAESRVPRAVVMRCDLGAPVDAGEHAGWAEHAVCSEVIEHVDDPVAFLQNAARFLAPGGRLVVTVPGGPRSAFDRHIGHRRHYRPRDLRATLAAAGFEVDCVVGAGFPFFNLYRLVVVLRGRQLIRDVAATDDSEPGSAFARFVMRTFGVLFRANLDRSRLGWQIVAVAHTAP